MRFLFAVLAGAFLLATPVQAQMSCPHFMVAFAQNLKKAKKKGKVYVRRVMADPKRVLFKDAWGKKAERPNYRGFFTHASEVQPGIIMRRHHKKVAENDGRNIVRRIGAPKQHYLTLGDGVIAQINEITKAIMPRGVYHQKKELTAPGKLIAGMLTLGTFSALIGYPLSMALAEGTGKAIADMRHENELEELEEEIDERLEREFIFRHIRKLRAQARKSPQNATLLGWRALASSVNAIQFSKMLMEMHQNTFGLYEDELKPIFESLGQITQSLPHATHKLSMEQKMGYLKTLTPLGFKEKLNALRLQIENLQTEWGFEDDTIAPLLEELQAWKDQADTVFTNIDEATSIIAQREVVLYAKYQDWLGEHYAKQSSEERRQVRQSVFPELFPHVQSLIDHGRPKETRRIYVPEELQETPLAENEIDQVYHNEDLRIFAILAFPELFPEDADEKPIQKLFALMARDDFSWKKKLPEDLPENLINHIQNNATTRLVLEELAKRPVAQKIMRTSPEKRVTYLQELIGIVTLYKNFKAMKIKLKDKQGGFLTLEQAEKQLFTFE